ncbi:MAG TPA: enoyl-CoA hydratase-related protein [Acidimicrobiales bacterium]|nr:enoyl-CoA hydratase-related protein [Acidimicrobiales bacterium]
MTLVESTVVESVMTITLCDEERRNALSAQLCSELLDAIDEAEGNDHVRVVVVTNRGTVFCAGANLAERSKVEEPAGERRVEFSELFRRISASPKPFVGRLNGHCVAGGVGLAAVMDISVAVDSAKFGFTEVRVGVAPAIISVVCLPKMRLGDAKSAFLRGQRFSAADAAAMGLITKSVASGELDHEIEAVVNDLLAGEPHAIAASKQLTNFVPTMSSEDAFVWTAALSQSFFATDEAIEGMTAFLEKRPASWVRKVSNDPTS